MSFSRSLVIRFYLKIPGNFMPVIFSDRSFFVLMWYNLFFTLILIRVCSNIFCFLCSSLILSIVCHCVGDLSSVALFVVVVASFRISVSSLVVWFSFVPVNRAYLLLRLIAYLFRFTAYQPFSGHLTPN